MGEPSSSASTSRLPSNNEDSSPSTRPPNKTDQSYDEDDESTTMLSPPSNDDDQREEGHASPYGTLSRKTSFQDDGEEHVFEDRPLYQQRSTNKSGRAGGGDEEQDESPENNRGGGERGISGIHTSSTQLGLMNKRHPRHSTSSPIHQIWSICKEALPTLLLSLLSLIFSGELLIHLARWPVFLKVDKLFVLLPILLNLKGNLEMNLSLRMSTSANIGELDIRRTRATLIVGNMTLLQVQALIVSAAAGILAFVLGLAGDEEGNTSALSTDTTTTTDSTRSNMLPMMALRALGNAIRSKQRRQSPPGTFQPRRIIHHHPKPPTDPALRLRNGYFEFVLILATGMLSASVSSAILGNFMCALVVVARQTGLNPDNIASPLAASLGDLLTLVVVGLISSSLLHFEGTILATLIFLALLVACAICFYVTLKNTYVRELLSSGWIPLIVAMFISSGAGLVLDSYVQKYEGFALLAPIATGLPGACAAILVSRTSTALHSGKGEVALGSSSQQSGGSSYLLGGSSSRPGPSKENFLTRQISSIRKNLRPIEGYTIPATLLFIGLIIQLVFMSFTWLTGQLLFSWPFLLTFTLTSFLGLTSALLIGQGLTSWLWSRDYDPDIYCLPYVSSLVDVIGQGLLVGAFALAAWLGDEVKSSLHAGEGHGGM